MKTLLMLLGALLLAGNAHAKPPTNFYDYNYIGTAARLDSDTTLPNTFPFTSASTVITATSKTELALYRIDCSVDCLLVAQPNIVTPTAHASASTLLRANAAETLLIEPKTNIAVRAKGATSGEINITKLKP